MAHKEVIVN